jgi:hypothetical protein
MCVLWMGDDPDSAWGWGQDVSDPDLNRLGGVNILKEMIL